MFAANGERLAGRATGDKLDRAFVRAEIDTAYIAFNEGPVAKRFQAQELVFADSIAAIAVPLDYRDGLKARPANANSQATRAGEQFNGFHEFSPESFEFELPEYFDRPIGTPKLSTHPIPTLSIAPRWFHREFDWIRVSTSKNRDATWAFYRDDKGDGARNNHV